MVHVHKYNANYTYINKIAEGKTGNLSNRTGGASSVSSIGSRNAVTSKGEKRHIRGALHLQVKGKRGLSSSEPSPGNSPKGLRASIPKVHPPNTRKKRMLLLSPVSSDHQCRIKMPASNAAPKYLSKKPPTAKL